MCVIRIPQIRGNLSDRHLRILPQPLGGLLQPIAANDNQWRKPDVAPRKPLYRPNRDPQMASNLLHPHLSLIHI